MEQLHGQSIVVLDLETRKSADDCMHCGQPFETCHQTHYGAAGGHSYEKIGWENKLALGLSIGCYWDYQDGALHWFDCATLWTTLLRFNLPKPLLVSFNGISFDFALMRALLRYEGRSGQAQMFPTEAPPSENVRTLACDQFKALCTTSYDLLREIWKIDPQNKFGRGLNSLDALCQANGLPLKEMDGATAPRLWAQGRYAEVIGYNVGDVLRTKALFEMVCQGKPILRGNGLPIQLPLPAGIAAEEPGS